MSNDSRENRKRRALLLFVKILVVMIIIAVIAVVFLKKTKLDDVKVNPGKRYSEEEIKQFVIGDNKYDNALYIYFKYKYSDQKPIPFIEYVDVELNGLNSLTLTAYDKSVIGCITYMNQYLYFDKNGIFVETSEERVESVPFLTGLEFHEINLNSKIDVGNDDIYDVILNITQLIDQYEISVDEIHFDSSFNISLICGKIEVTLGKHSTYDEQIAKLKNLLPKTEGLSGVLHMENYDGTDADIIFNKKEE